MDLHTLMSAYADGGSARTETMGGLGARHRADGPAAEGLDGWPLEFEPRHRGERYAEPCTL